MKAKVTLLSLLFAKSIAFPAQAVDEQNQFDYYDKYDAQEEEAPLPSGEKAEEEHIDLIKLSGDIKASPSITLKGGSDTTYKHPLKSTLTFKANIPQVINDLGAEAKIGIRWDRENFKSPVASIVFGGRNKFTVGYDSSLLGFEKSNPFLPMAVDASVLQVKFVFPVHAFRIGVGVEEALELKTGLFDAHHTEEEDDRQEDDKNKKKEKVNRLNDPKGKNYFKLKNSFPVGTAMIEWERNGWHINASGLGRFTDYTYYTDPAAKKEEKEKKAANRWCLTWGTYVGMEYKAIPDKLTLTLEGFYVDGLGDYIAGLADIQGDKERQEMCATYYTNEKKEITNIKAYGVGGTIEYFCTPKWVVSAAGGTIQTLNVNNKQEQIKPNAAFNSQWTVRLPEVGYKFSKYLTVSAGYHLEKEYGFNFKKKEKEDKGSNHKIFGMMKLTF